MNHEQIKYRCTSPCANCPYRKDSKLALWSEEEFKDLIENDADFWGSVYLCHKKNGNVCVGWLMDQDQRNHPSMNLRIDMSRNGVTREYLDRLHGPTERYGSILEIARANYPQTF